MDRVPADGWGYLGPEPVAGGTRPQGRRQSVVLPEPGLGCRPIAGRDRRLVSGGGRRTAEWAGRRVALTTEFLNSFASVYVDGRKVADMRFPAGEADLTAMCRPGEKHVLSMLVIAMPLKAVMMSYNDSDAAKEVRVKSRARPVWQRLPHRDPQGARIRACGWSHRCVSGKSRSTRPWTAWTRRPGTPSTRRSRRGRRRSRSLPASPQRG